MLAADKVNTFFNFIIVSNQNFKRVNTKKRGKLLISPYRKTFIYAKQLIYHPLHERSLNHHSKPPSHHEAHKQRLNHDPKQPNPRKLRVHNLSRYSKQLNRHTRHAHSLSYNPMLREHRMQKQVRYRHHKQRLVHHNKQHSIGHHCHQKHRQLVIPLTPTQCLPTLFFSFVSLHYLKNYMKRLSAPAFTVSAG
jgi:hypothetical protein